MFWNVLAVSTLISTSALFAAWSQSSTPTPAQSQAKNGNGQTANGQASGVTVMEIIEGGRDFTTMSQALQSAELSELLSHPGPFTLFIPNNTAFSEMPEGTRQKLFLPENRERLVAILKNHIVRGKILPNDLKAGSYKTLNGKDIVVTDEQGQKKVNGAKILKNTAIGKNGVIYVIDTVLSP
jgi:uncharacterized surface protein with fasciclin (FAS1) repeats